jgi:hypothetical protein
LREVTTTLSKATTPSSATCAGASAAVLSRPALCWPPTAGRYDPGRPASAPDFLAQAQFFRLQFGQAARIGRRVPCPAARIEIPAKIAAVLARSLKRGRDSRNDPRCPTGAASCSGWWTVLFLALPVPL